VLLNERSDEDVMSLFSVDVKLLTVRLTDGALASDFFPEAYRGNVDDDGAGALEGVPVRWMAVEQLEDVVACRAARYQPTTDVVRSLVSVVCLTEHCVRCECKTPSVLDLPSQSFMSGSWSFPERNLVRDIVRFYHFHLSRSSRGSMVKLLVRVPCCRQEGSLANIA